MSEHVIMVNIIVIQCRNAHHKEMSQSVGIILSVTSCHPAASSASHPEWSEFDQRLPVEFPCLPPLKAPTLGWQGIVAPVFSIVGNPTIVVLNSVVVVVVIDPAVRFLLNVDILIPP